MKIIFLSLLLSKVSALTFRELDEHYMGCMAALSIIDDHNSYEVKDDICTFIVDVRKAQYNDKDAEERVLMTIEETKKKRLDYLRLWLEKRTKEKQTKTKGENKDGKVSGK